MALTQTATQSGQIAIPTIPSGQEIYNTLMSRIEPELMTTQVNTLTEKYKNETPEQAKQRQVRYDAAFVEYGKQFAAFNAELGSLVHACQREALASAEWQSRSDELQKLTALETTITKQ